RPRRTRARRSPDQRPDRRAREPCPRGLRTAVEDVEACPLERLDRGQATLREGGDRTADAAADPPAERAAGREVAPRASRLERQQLDQLLARRVELRDPEPAAVVSRQVDAAELEVSRDVLDEVDELEAGADVVAQGDGLGIAEPAEHAQYEPAARVGGVDAVALHVVPRLVLGDALVDPVRLDQ